MDGTENTSGITSISALLIQKDIGYIQKDITSIKQSIDSLRGEYVTHLEFDDMSRAFALRITALETQRHLWRWLTPTLAAAVAVVIEYLFLFYIQHLK